ncbi:hypothetical protein DL93DRAFT_2078475 [Clavulina sp. PMI_390]|nr:hypothetical protein DL93DRAFT_2078475 [Clavulina sp. PMI_390]
MSAAICVASPTTAASRSSDPAVPVGDVAAAGDEGSGRPSEGDRHAQYAHSARTRPRGLYARPMIELRERRGKIGWTSCK